MNSWLKAKYALLCASAVAQVTALVFALVLGATMVGLGFSGVKSLGANTGVCGSYDTNFCGYRPGGGYSITSPGSPIFLPPIPPPIPEPDAPDIPDLGLQ